MKYQSGGTWTQGTPKIRRNGEWIQIGASNGGGGGGGGGGEGLDGGFGWNQTFTDTSWVTDAGDDLNVETVTNLDASGSGSLQSAVGNASGPTVVVFEVGGVIDLRGSGDLNVGSDNVWIAGETAPDPGVSVIGGGIVVDGSEVIVSHVGAYYGDEASDGEALKMYGDHIVFDHCSAFWGVDEIAGASDPVSQCSFINCIFAEGLFNGPHPEGQHSRGMLFNDSGTDICVMGSIFAHNNRRHPMSRSDIVLVNNYIYNGGWDGELIHFNSGAHPVVTSKGLYVEDGPDSASGNSIHLYSADLYHDDVVSEPSGRSVADSSLTILDSPALVPSGLDLEADPVPGSEVPAWTKANAGMRPANRPQVDADLIGNRVGDGQGGPVDSQNDVGGYPNYSPTSRSTDVPSSGLLSWIQGFTEEVELGTAGGNQG